MFETVHISGVDVSILMLVGFAVFMLGGLCSVYVAFRAKRWRSFLPYNPFSNKKSAVRIYFEQIRENRWSKIPIYVWFICQPLGVVTMMIGFLQFIKK